MASTENPVHRFREFFHYIDSVPTGPDATPLQERSLVMDWQCLADFDAQLAQQLLHHPDAVMGYAREALTALGETRSAVDGLPQFRIRHLNVDMHPEQLAAVPLGRLVSVSGILVATTNVQPALTVIAVECQYCGRITKKRSFGLTTSCVESCPSCGREDNVPVTTESEFIDTQYGRLVVTDSAAGGHSESVHLCLDGALQPATPGTPVTVTGVVRPCQHSELNSDPSLQTRFIDCWDIVPQDTVREPVLPSMTWTLNDLAAQPAYLAELADAIAPTVDGFWRAKLLLALLYATPSRPEPQSAQRIPNVLLFAPQSPQRRQLLRAFYDWAPDVQYQATAEGHVAPIVADIKKAASNWWVETGPLVQAVGGLAIVDGLEDATETQQVYLTEALSRPGIRLAKAGIELTLETCDHLFATATPTTETPADRRDAVPVDEDVYAAFDFQLIDSPAGTTEQSDLTRVWAEDLDTESREVPAARPDTEAYRSALQQARSLEQPTISDAAQRRLQNSQIDYSVLVWTATALARLCGQQYVRPRDVGRAKSIVTMMNSSTL